MGEVLTLPVRKPVPAAPVLPELGTDLPVLSRVAEALYDGERGPDYPTWWELVEMSWTDPVLASTVKRHEDQARVVIRAMAPQKPGLDLELFAAIHSDPHEAMSVVEDWLEAVLRHV